MHVGLKGVQRTLDPSAADLAMLQDDRTILTAVFAAAGAESKTTPDEVVFVRACIETLRETFPGNSHEVAFVWGEHDKVPEPLFAESMAASDTFDGAQLVALVEVNPGLPALFAARTRVIPVPRRWTGQGCDAAEGRLESAKKLAEKKAPKNLARFREFTAVRGQQKVDSPPGWYGVTERLLCDLDPPQTDPRRVLLGMHWFEHGGAEEWAVQAVEIAASQGLEVTVSTSFPGHIDYVNRLRESAAILRPVGSALLLHERSMWTSHAFSQRPRTIMIHHSPTLYKALPEWKLMSPNTFVLDSTHIIEHKSGGYVHDSIKHSPFIDLHHVISPGLRDFMIFQGGVAPSKVAYHPLTDSFTNALGEAPAVDDVRNRGLRIGFLGRFVRQKRPHLFIRTAEEASRLCRRAGLSEPTFVMQGDGPQRSLVEETAAKARATVEVRGWADKGSFFRDIDLLLVSSENEGLTLTSLEAVDRGVPVVSADVGSQVTIVGRAGLLPRSPDAFESIGARRILRHAREPGTLGSLLASQRALAADLLRQQPAGQFLTELLKEVVS